MVSLIMQKNNVMVDVVGTWGTIVEMKFVACQILGNKRKPCRFYLSIPVRRRRAQ